MKYFYLKKSVFILCLVHIQFAFIGVLSALSTLFLLPPPQSLVLSSLSLHLIVLGRNVVLLLLSPRTVSSDSLKCLNKYFPSESESTLRLLPFFLFPIFVPTTLELQVPTTISNLEYFAVPPTRELKMPLITLFPKSLFSFAI